MKPRIKLGYADFWQGFDPENDYFTRIIRRHYDVELSAQPDFLIYSVFGWQHLRHRCVRVFYTGENVRADFRDCDYAFTFDYSDRPEHYRLPYYARRISSSNLSKRAADVEAVLARKTRFCTFVYSDPTGLRRNQFLQKLSRYKVVDSGGGYLNNVGGRVADKLAFVAESKFNIAFEHTSHPGYTTEKITDAMQAWSLPIYWGNPLVGRDFDSRSFLNVHEFPSEEAVIARIIELDRDDALYAEVLSQPWFPNDRGNVFMDEDNILSQFDRIFTTDIVPIARRRRRLAVWDLRLRPLLRRAQNRMGRRPRLWLEALGRF